MEIWSPTIPVPLTEGATTLPAALAGAGEGPRSLADPVSETPSPSYVIRLPHRPGPAGCDACGTGLFAAGATGHVDGRPICELCLLERCQPLGLVLALVSVTRAYATTPTEPADDHRAALHELGAFARVFERAAARHGPPRYLRWPDLPS